MTLGKRSQATIRRLGYPTKNALKTWCDEFVRGGELKAVVPTQSHLRVPAGLAWGIGSNTLAKAFHLLGSLVNP